MVFFLFICKYFFCLSCFFVLFCLVVYIAGIRTRFSMRTCEVEDAAGDCSKGSQDWCDSTVFFKRNMSWNKIKCLCTSRNRCYQKINITLHAKLIITQKGYSAYLAIFVRLIFPSVAVGQCIFRNPPVSIISSLSRDSGDFCDFS